MSFIFWTADLDTGFDDIDEQHQILVDYINKLYDANETGDREQILNEIQGVIDYAGVHFGLEEQMLAEAQYPMLEPHKKVHQNFVTKMVDFQSRYENGDNEAVAEMLNLLDGWLFRHIRLNDHGYIDCVKKSGVRR